jgi:bleomycin hydrolase
MHKSLFIIALSFIVCHAFSQEDKGVFKEYAPNTFMKMILMDNSLVEEASKEKPVDKVFFMDQAGMELPNKIDLYKDNTIWHNPTVSQGRAGTCWCFSTTSFYESEIKRLSGKEVKLSEIYTVYWEYVEKARRFVQERGKSNFSEGSEANAVTRIYKDFGIVPNEVYTGLLYGKKFHDHSNMVDEMSSFLKSVRQRNNWNEELVLSTIQSILNHYIGKPPTEFKVDGKTYTPKSYLNNYLNLKMDDYVEILSYKQEPYWQQVEYKVPDNWWHSKEYYNVPLDEFMSAVKESIKKGYGCSIGGDVSEAGFSRETNVALIPTFDIPSEFINEDARQFRFSNKTTTDDHGMHLVGYTNYIGKTYFLIKDSSSGSRQGEKDAPEFGYYFFHEDYVKLKMMGFTVHKDAVKNLLKKF